jgi:hypothetical protein
MPAHRLLIGVCGVLAILAHRSAYAQQPVQPGVGAGQGPELVLWIGHAESDNILRSVDAVSGSYDSAGVLWAAAHDSPRLNGYIDTDIEFRSYSAVELDNETVGTIDGALRVGIVPERFLWNFDEDFDQGRIDGFSAWTPGNRESVNVFSTGPLFDIPLGQRTSMQVSGEYATARYEETEHYDSDATRYELSLLRHVRRTTALGLEASTEEIEYVDEQTRPYEIDRLSLTYGKELMVGGVSAELGVNEISDDLGSRDAPFLNFEWFRPVTNRATLSVRAERSFIDSAGVVGAQRTVVPEYLGADVILTLDPFERRSVEVEYAITGIRTFISTSVALSEDTYTHDSSYDNEATTLRFDFDRVITRHLTLGLSLYRLDRSFTDQSSADDVDQVASVWVNMPIGSRFSFALAYSNYEREGNVAYDENRVEARFSYSPTQSTRLALRTVGR